MSGMDSKIVRDFWPEIENYCLDNNLSLTKIKDMVVTYNNEAGWVLFLYNSHDTDRAKLGLKDDKPMPVALRIFLENGKLRFVQTEHTRKYLGVAAPLKAAVA